MKMSPIVLSTAFFVTLFASSAFSRGLFITPGTRATSLGSNYIGIADDATAIYWNPAGLAQLDNSGGEISSFYASNSAKSNTSLANVSGIPNSANGDFPLTKIYPTEPAEFTSKELKTEAFVPFVAAYRKCKDIVFAVGFYGIGGGGGKWSDTIFDPVTGTDKITGSVDAYNALSVANISAAKQITANILVGFGIDFVTVVDNLTIKKEYQLNSGSALSLNPLLTSYSIAMERTASGSGIELVGGLLYKLQDNLSAGIVIRSGNTIKLTGKGKYNQTGLAGIGMPDTAFSTDLTQNYVVPLTYGIGTAYNPTKKLTIALGVDMSNYSTMKQDYSYSSQLPGVFDDTNTNSGWKDTAQLHAGAEFRPIDKLSFQAGLQTDPVPFSRDTLTLLDINQYNLTYLTIGAGYEIKIVKLYFSYSSGISNKPETATRTYEYPLNLYRLSVSTNF